MLVLSTRLALDSLMTARRSLSDPCMLSAACDFLISLLLKSHALFGKLFSLERPVECSCKSQILVSSSSSDEELGHVRINLMRRRL
ncbi:hypothetical protein F2Q69_00052697 [Brassica cretica]|uniref:Uncharacterized protein n=1 Tax=Brassica cretica TaxID=69181 RepID=A0A8S9MU29_BRACR|nr:hypothetical protein F2Q69_00052697 [Brassica cretica]